MSKLHKIVGDFLRQMIMDSSVPKPIRKHLAADMRKKGAKEIAVIQQISIVKDKSKPVVERKAALSILIQFHRGEI